MIASGQRPTGDQNSNRGFDINDKKRWQGRRDSNPGLLLIASGQRPTGDQNSIRGFDINDKKRWQGRRDSNPRPTVLETATLTS
jgi:hypothetical protein